MLGEFAQEVDSHHKESEEGQEEVLIVRCWRQMGDIATCLEYAARSKASW